MNSNCPHVVRYLRHCSPSYVLFTVYRIRYLSPTHQYNLLRFTSLVAGGAETTAHLVTANDAAGQQVRSELVFFLDATTETSTQGAVNIELCTSDGDFMGDFMREHITTTSTEHGQSESSEVIEDASFSTRDVATENNSTDEGHSNSKSSELCGSSEELSLSSEERKYFVIVGADEGEVSWIGGGEAHRKRDEYFLASLV